MASFVIVGKKECEFFAHACYVAQILKDCLPNFRYTRHAKKFSEWVDWIASKNRRYGWNHSMSPVIYKELTIRGGEPFYIGTIYDFWEYISNYYGLEYILPPAKLLALRNDNIHFYDKKERKSKLDAKTIDEKIYQVCICGADQTLLSIFLPELIRTHELYGQIGIAFYLYNPSDKKLSDLEDEPDLYDNSDTYFIYVQSIDYLDDYLKQADLMIIFGSIMKYDWYHEFDKYIDANIEVMIEYAEQINLNAKKNLRVIVACPPTCYNATILTQCVKKIKLSNIIAVTADIGLEALSTVARVLNVSIGSLSAPPVYGFCNINQLIDIDNIVQKYEYFRPTKRAVNEKNCCTTLNTGTSYTELRPLSYLTYNKHNIFWREIYSRKKKIEELLERPAYLSKIHATINLIKCWYSKTDEGVILSAGIQTEGLYGITVPMVFSQPLKLKHGTWQPFTGYPKPLQTVDVEDLVPYATSLVIELKEKVYQLRGRFTVCDEAGVLKDDDENVL